MHQIFAQFSVPQKAFVQKWAQKQNIYLHLKLNLWPRKGESGILF
jgi:hypothetical protein